MGKEENIVYLYCDGACQGNPGPGGWGVLLRYNQYERHLYNGAANTTNNQMEITAAIEGLKALKRPCHVIVTTDSQYLYRGITEWLPVWKDRQWKTSNKKSVKNRALWEALEYEIKRHTITWYWVKGHSGHVENEIADQLANCGMDTILENFTKTNL
ncbi:ribonuclease HI [Coxiella endosymbiont of Amblyomma nuttalli]|uniref:ribonuclease HI n=1 Tax=Coxiella endosymbiont of Amblyomma nuttalli TaxID=2749996 RepID=UPI001BAD77AD|nr:ribonuclease HI [Coxiella endosymbiont of Amblyomma nuttalli]QTS84042.1 Ribonuclease HI [Coxiella endosymbiont of Amblyomma nuttalli]